MIWSSILSEVSTRSRSKLPSGKNVLIMGETGAGKTTLIAKLQGVEEYMKGRGLEYLYFNVHDDDIDDHAMCNAWILDGDLYHKGLQKFAVCGENMADTMALLVVDMSRPWTVLDSLQKWASVLREHIDKLRVNPETLRDMEQRLVRQFRSTQSQGVTTAPLPRGGTPWLGRLRRSVWCSPWERTHSHTTWACLLWWCVQSILFPSLHFPHLQCDMFLSLEKEHDYREEHFDFIQSHIRHFCLQYGAALLYTSMKENKNLDLLYKYLVHRLYGFPFDMLAQVVDKDSVFIPSGWDNEKKVAILYENFQSLKREDKFEEVIIQPPVRKFVHEKELGAEDDQVFLLKLQTLLSKQPPAAAGRPVDTTNRAPSGSPRVSNRSATANVANVMPMQPGGQTSEGVLANFFNSLLSKKTGEGGGANNTPRTVRKSVSKVGLDGEPEASSPTSSSPPADMEES
ncbi:cytoplasmic dynein 1 light intermediate chain 1-like isoform X2 [Oncorhynchus keta]|uniref:cytoplasmic dynein 1 light intermediate chain 1-like isoform X2 n=1 Tax=Oncorhynchus keta TaxID=8018 RepID=UPI00227A6F06|nr:cytoplasmic dynein 1 light intermediate chain 1-like isoform X2 [Oncorhynchus keta]